MLTPPPVLPPLKKMKALTVWLNELRNFASSLNPMPSHTVRVNHTAIGTSWDATIETASPSKITAYTLQTIHDDYLTCSPFLSPGNPDPDSDHYVLIAKPHGLRKKGWDSAGAPPAPAINGITYTWPTAADSTKRVATAASPVSTQTEYITPDYIEGFSIIYAAEVGTNINIQVETDPGPPSVTEEVTLLDLNVDGRAWGKA